jgi:DNA-directed RNA polymerase subunit RPC12/RpoP
MNKQTYKCAHCGELYQIINDDNPVKRMYCSPPCYSCDVGVKTFGLEEAKRLGMLCEQCQNQGS